MKKKKVFLRSIRSKLIIMFLAVSIIPIAIIGILSNRSATKALEFNEYNQLETVGHLKADEIKMFFNETIHNVEYFTTLPPIEPAILELDDLSKEAKNKGYFGRLRDYAPFKAAFDKNFNFLKAFHDKFEFEDVFLISPNSGRIILSADLKSDFGTELKDGQTHLARAWQEMNRTKKVVVTDFDSYEPSNGMPAMFVVVPSFNNGVYIGSVAIQVSIDKIDAIMQENIGLGETGETYIVGDDYLMRCNSRFSQEGTILKKKVDTESVRLGLNDETSVHIIADHGGDEVLSFYSHLGLNETIGADFEWVIIAEIHKEEAFESIYDLRNQMILFGLIIVLLVALIAFLFARIISTPLIQLTDVARAMSIGDLNQEITVHASDEIGELANSFSILQSSISEKARQAEEIAAGNLVQEVIPLSDKDVMGIAFSSMIVNLREQIERITEGVNVLSSSSSEIMAMVSQLASSSAETATSVSETTSTVEEVRQTVELSNQKANEVADSAQKTSMISQDGKSSVQETIEGMIKIKEQMESIAGIVIQLSEKSHTIGEIAATVNELSEQSNLLAVNAAIEAAKAGEQGKGFTIVAQEIKNLAERSKESTIQIRTILSDIQKGISNAVMATEQGRKVIDDGLELSSTASEVITALAASVEEASQAALQISASSQQQLIGIDQITYAMENINEASAQNSGSIKQTEESVTELNNLGGKLLKILQQYKLK